MPWHAVFVCPSCSDRVMSPAIDCDARLEFFELLIRTTQPESTYACPTCGQAPFDPEDRKRALFSGVDRGSTGRVLS